MITYGFARWQQPTFFFSLENSFQIGKNKYSQGILRSFYHCTLQMPSRLFSCLKISPVWEHTCWLHFFTAHSFCNQLQSTSYSDNSSEIILKKDKHFPLINKTSGRFLVLALFASLRRGSTDRDNFSSRCHPSSNTEYSYILTTILQATPINPISSFSLSRKSQPDEHDQTAGTRMVHPPQSVLQWLFNT